MNEITWVNSLGERSRMVELSLEDITEYDFKEEIPWGKCLYNSLAYHLIKNNLDEKFYYELLESRNKDNYIMLFHILTNLENEK